MLLLLQGLLVLVLAQQQRTTQQRMPHSMEQHLAQLEPMTQLSTLLLHMQVSPDTQGTPLGHLLPQHQGTMVGDMIFLMLQAEISDIQVCREFRVRKF